MQYIEETEDGKYECPLCFGEFFYLHALCDHLEDDCEYSRTYRADSYVGWIEENCGYRSSNPKTEAKRRDSWVCQKCGYDGKQYTKSKVEAHHIIPKSDDGPNVVDNLIALCKNCHRNGPTRILGLSEFSPIERINWFEKYVSTGLRPEWDYALGGAKLFYQHLMYLHSSPDYSISRALPSYRETPMWDIDSKHLSEDSQEKFKEDMKDILPNPYAEFVLRSGIHSAAKAYSTNIDFDPYFLDIEFFLFATSAEELPRPYEVAKFFDERPFYDPDVYHISSSNFHDREWKQYQDMSKGQRDEIKDELYDLVIEDGITALKYNDDYNVVLATEVWADLVCDQMGEMASYRRDL